MEQDTNLIDTTTTTITTTTTTTTTTADADIDDGLADELLIEEISIDGMCGVY